MSDTTKFDKSLLEAFTSDRNANSEFMNSPDMRAHMKRRQAFDAERDAMVTAILEQMVGNDPVPLRDIAVRVAVEFEGEHDEFEQGKDGYYGQLLGWGYVIADVARVSGRWCAVLDDDGKVLVQRDA